MIQYSEENKMEDNVQLITIPVHTDIDPSTLLDIAISFIEDIKAAIESSSGETAVIMEEEISVENDDTIFGGE
jgi:hypothetical protein